MHILVDYRPALRQRTGVGEYVHHLTASLARRLPSGDTLTLFSSSWKDRLSPDAVPAARRLDVAIPVRALNFAWHRLQWPPIERLGAAPDVVWTLHPLLMPSRAAAQVVTVHDLFFLDHPEATRAEIRRDYPALAARHTARADAVIVISHHTRTVAAGRLKIPVDKMTVCYPGRPDWQPRAEPAAPGPILHVGTIEPRKNVAAVLTAYQTLASAGADIPPLLFAGAIATPTASDASVDRDRVRFLGYVSTDEKLRLYREASMLVIAASDEGFGITALEAMTIGVPVVAVARGALPEVIGDAGLLVDGPEQLAPAMQRLLSDPALRSDLARRGIERARMFDWDASADALVGAFRSAHARRRERR